MAIDPIKVRAMIPDEIPDDSLSTAIDDAPIEMSSHGVSQSHPSYDYLARLMVCHLLFMRGWGRTLLSAGVGDLSTGYADVQLGDKEGMSPYLFEFLKKAPITPFVITI